MKENKIYSGVECVIYSSLTDGFALEESPLVTVSVTAYNSSKFILETLESIKNQTYHNIILQISDDCSKDNTLELCQKWIAENQKRFYKTKIIAPLSNTGVSANCNRSWDECETEWLKGIAGDDTLLPTCIEEYMKFVSSKADSVFVFSRPYLFGLAKDECEKYDKERFHYDFFTWTPEQQYEDLRHGSKIPAATAFCNMEKIRQAELRHDERIPMLEDRPKWINVVWKGLKMDFLDKQLVGYRLRSDSLSNAGLLNPRFYESTRLAYYYYDFQIVYKNDPEKAIRDAVEYEKNLYQQYYNLVASNKHILIRIALKITKLFCRK